jgi:L-methionine (R)-S-oxide reductase
MGMCSPISNSITTALRAGLSRSEKARNLAMFVSNLGGYRWVGIYDIGPELVSLLAYSGSHPPLHQRFPVTKGLTGAAVREKKTIAVGDVSSDPRYLTSFPSTGSEIIIPVLEEKTGLVVGTIDVESERADAFSEEHRRILEECARAALRLWTEREG